MSNQFLDDLKRYCLAGNFTDQEQFQRFFAQYCERINAVKELCDTLQGFLERGMVDEAVKFYNQTRPPLRDQMNALRFPSLQDFLDTADIYGMELPQRIDETVLERLDQQVKARRGIQQLLAEFRQIASSNDLARKMELARQILEIQPGNAQWAKTLHDLEEKRKTELTGQARDAIIQHQEDKLQEIQACLIGIPWNTPPDPRVLAKIERTLHEWRLAALTRQAEALAEEVDRLYGEDFEANLDLLGHHFQRWDAICSEEEDFAPPEVAKSHVEEVRRLWEHRKAELQQLAERQQQFAVRRLRLQELMDKGADCEELDSAYHALLAVAEGGLPHEDEQRYQACLQRASALASRRRVGKFLGSLVALIVLGALLVLGWGKFKENQLCNEYIGRINAILTDTRREATECDEILSEMEQAHPELLAKPKIAVIRERVATRQAEQRKVRLEAEGQLAKLQEQLKDYKENRQAIQNGLTVLKKMTLTASLQKQVDQLDAELKTIQAKFAAQQSKEFRRAQLEAEANLGKLSRATAEGATEEVLRYRQTLRQVAKQLEDLEQDLEKNELETCKRLRTQITEAIGH